ncbi:hypothetical protein ABTZ78_06930 [Streptomyces bauhiniae]|uniref:hypothetical protein n=1 Tax=Streptomyces bauhiniae TaxID=2340725 RepID=UPI003320A079
MADLTYADLMAVDLTKLGASASHWRSMASELDKLATDARDGLAKKSEGARWKGVNADVGRDFVRKTVKEFSDLHAEALSIANVLTDAHDELVRYQKQARTLTDAARHGDSQHEPPDPGLMVGEGPGGTVRVMEMLCTPEGPDQRTKDRMRWYADTLTGIVQHAAEVDAAAKRALRASHGNDPDNAGHSRYTSLDEDQLPRARKLAALSADAKPGQRAELRRLWESLSPEARARLWLAQQKDLEAAGILTPAMQQVAADAGAGRHGSESAGAGDWSTKEKMRLLAEGADWKGMTDASRNMSHYLGNSGAPMTLPVDKMMADVPAFKQYVDGTVTLHQDAWREQALKEFKENGGKPVAFPVEVKRRPSFYFTQEDNPNWFYAVGGTNSNVTGVVTAVPDEHGAPKVSVDYQVNVWDRYNWDDGKGVKVGPLDIPDGEMAKLHRVGLAQEFDMSGSSDVKHYDLGSSASGASDLPGSEESRDGRTNPTREQQQGRTHGAAQRAAGR